MESKKLTLVSSLNTAPLDPKKETMVLVFTRLSLSKEQENIIGWHQKFVKEFLEPRYNLVWVGVDNNPERFLEMGYTNVYFIRAADFDAIKAQEMKRVREMPENSEVTSSEYNRHVVLAHFRDELPDVSPEHVMWLDERWAFLPLRDYWNKKAAATPEAEAINDGNEFHDYTGNDPQVITKIREISQRINTSYDLNVGILTYSYWMKNLIHNLGKWFITKGVAGGKFKKSYYFVIDPGNYYRMFDDMSPNHSNYAMAKDFRGTRDFEYFPMQKMQHFVFEDNSKVDKTKKRKFCFYGTIFLSKGTRKNLWDTYFKDLRGDGIDLYVPPKMDGHIAERKKESASLTRFNKRLGDDNDISDLADAVLKHPCYRGYLDNTELNKILAGYEYAFIAKNIAHYDSANFRPALYISLDVFPIVDCRYDPEFKDIPEEIQRKITVKNHTDILSMMEYYDSHPEEKAKVMKALKEYYELDTFAAKWKESVAEALDSKL